MTAAVSYVGQAKIDAERALQEAFADPQRSSATARAALAAARAADDPLAESLAQQALGLAARLLGQVAEAVGRLEESVATAERAGLPARAAEARISLSLALTMAGRTASALETLDSAAQTLRGVKLAQLRVQRALILRRLGRLDAAYEELRQALPTLRRARNHLLVARALNERGLLQVDRGGFAAAEADLRHSQELFRSLGQLRDAAATGHNRGWCAARAGDVVAALRLYDAAEADLAELGIVMGEVPLDRARVLLSAGLATDARELAARAAAIHEGAADRAGRAEAVLTVAEAALAAGDFESARREAADAKRAFAQQRRPGWQALARHVDTRAAWASGDRSATALHRARKVAADLEALGLPLLAGEALLIAGRTAAALNRHDEARESLNRASRARTAGPAPLRIQGWLAEALLRLDSGRRSSAEAALRAGLRVLEAHRTSLGATELRAHASAAATDLATVGLGLAVESARPERVLAWTERWRAGSLAMRPVRPPEDRAVAAALGQLRRVLTDIEQAGAARHPTAELVARQAQLEQTIRRLCHRASGGSDDAARIPALGELVAALGERALMELIEVDGRLLGVVVAGGRARLVELGSHATAVSETESSRFALRRLASGRGSPASLAAASAALAHAGSRLDEQLLAPLRPWLGDRAVVVVPPASLHAVPWSILPSLRSRPVDVAPSAACWWRARLAPPPAKDQVVLVAGPGLAAADAELADLSAIHPGARRLAGPEATVEATTEAMAGASLAHVAAHGRFRSDNPLFSSLLLFDGPVTVYDLEALSAPPHRIVLSACDSGLGGTRPGDELMGLAAALFSLGTSALVVSVVPVPDGSTRTLMRALHRRLRAGAGLAEALAGARDEVASADPAMAAASAAFVCMGAG